jgi:predicted nuclease with TOPRIM domain
LDDVRRKTGGQMTTQEAITKRLEQLQNAMIAGNQQLKRLGQETEAMRKQMLIFKGGISELETLLQGVKNESVTNDEVSDETD